MKLEHNSSFSLASPNDPRSGVYRERATFREGTQNLSCHGNLSDREIRVLHGVVRGLDFVKGVTGSINGTSRPTVDV